MIRVNTHVGGSFLVVVLSDGDGVNGPTYIDVKTDVRYPGFRYLELVRAGFVREYDKCYKTELVGALMRMIRANIQLPPPRRQLKLTGEPL